MEPSSCSAEIVLTSLLLEKIELLERLESVDGERKGIISSHTKTGHEVLELDIEEDGHGDVVGVLLGQRFVGTTFSLSDNGVSVSLEEGGGISAESLGVRVSSLLGVRDTEGDILGDLIKVLSDSGEHISLWVLLNLSGFFSGGLVSSNIGISDGIITDIGKSLNVFVVVVVSSGGRDSSYESNNN